MKENASCLRTWPDNRRKRGRVPDEAPEGLLTR
ncbi:protein of unknown function [Azospirillum baldaniorum]|uniref:Uncharacterized protein n=1 Tax=Azospirillum baldaniorum TaxID=1064539 RepID=A0A9P1JS82_9PROT|nr:protein of unknown function [Azospirillum baldaniorum]